MDVPGQCVFVSMTNHGGYLKDIIGWYECSAAKRFGVLSEMPSGIPWLNGNTLMLVDSGLGRNDCFWPIAARHKR